MAGLPYALHLDGSAACKSKALKWGSGLMASELVYRKRERTQHGGHHERLIETTVRKRQNRGTLAAWALGVAQRFGFRPQAVIFPDIQVKSYRLLTAGCQR